MIAETGKKPTGSAGAAWRKLCADRGLTADENVESTVLIWDDDKLVATGSRQKNLLKCIAVDSAYEGEGLTATVISALRQDGITRGYEHLFLYTKPQNKLQFSSLFFYPIAQTDKVLLMENRKNGLRDYLATLPEAAGGTVGAAVMNCNPFTNGHLHLITKASETCDRVYIFVLSEENPPFPASDRLALVREGTAHLPNVTVLPTGPYLISSATFPTYFLKDRDTAETVHCGLDIEIFANAYAPRLGITKRFVGSEPLSAMTDQYNAALKEALPGKGIEVCEVPRLRLDGTPISATEVRSLLGTGNGERLRRLVPPTTYRYLEEHKMI